MQKARLTLYNSIEGMWASRDFGTFESPWSNLLRTPRDNWFTMQFNSPVFPFPLAIPSSQYPLTNNNRKSQILLCHFPCLITPILHHITTIQLFSWPFNPFYLLLPIIPAANHSIGTHSPVPACFPPHPLHFSFNIILSLLPRNILGSSCLQVF